MSLPNYLAKIKSAGMYRFTFDKSQIPAAQAETMRLVIGYSEKGTFNNPVYIDNKQDFISLFGNINKRLERKGVFFHRLALQALSAGPILALNLKPFTDSSAEGTEGGSVNEQVDYLAFNPCDIANEDIKLTKDSQSRSLWGAMDVVDLFDTDRFWKLDEDQLPHKVTKFGYPEAGSTTNQLSKYINIAATDSKELSCSVFVRGCHSKDVKQYEVTIRDWYKNLGEDIPEYLEGFENVLVKDFFAEVYVFRGEFTDALQNGVLNKYFSNGSLNTDYKNHFNEDADALAGLASDSNSNCIGVYRGCLLPYFKDLLGNYISLDILFNADKYEHKMIMKLNDGMIDELMENTTIDNNNRLSNGIAFNSRVGWNGDKNTALKPTYLNGYEYNTINRQSSAADIYNKSLDVLAYKGIFTALTNHVDSEYHYIVDTYNTLVDEAGNGVGCGKKVNIVNIAKAKDNCLAIMNFPAMSDLFRTSKYFEISSINKSNIISLPTENDGASYCAFYTPLVFGEGAVKSTVPSAAVVSNNFMEKWNSRQPYYIVAGPNYGRMDYSGLVGPDYNYSREDLDALESFGVNCMVYVPRKGTYINSNQTAKQTPVSALSKVHVRELVIYLQDEIEAMMQNYQWEMNTQTLRDVIKTKADTILEKIKANGGVYDYINVCDGTNNTPEVIDNEMIILDTSIEPARGAGKMVQRLTIHKTGGISSLTK